MVAHCFIRIPPTPPEQYVPPGWSGAPEIIVHHLTEELVRRGHEVTLFASGDSVTSGKLVGVTPVAISQTLDFSVPGAAHAAQLVRIHEAYAHVSIGTALQAAQAGAFDIVHSHFDKHSAPYAPLVSTPMISTLHSPLKGLVGDVLSSYKRTQYYASISDSQRKPLPDLQYAGTTYNGVEVDKIPFSAEKEDFFAVVGRMVPEKGVAEAIQVARKTGIRLKIFGSYDKTNDAYYQYWLEKIKPFIDGEKIQHMGMVERNQLFKELARAKAMLFPLQWEEPFGLVTVEAMAAGTPTIAFRKGSLPEIIEDGKSGFLVDNEDQMIEAISRVGEIKPEDCRARAQEFSIERMVDRYEEAYWKILDEKKN